MVSLVVPYSGYVDTQGPIEHTIGRALLLPNGVSEGAENTIDLEGEAGTLAIVRLILHSFIARSPFGRRPWSWSTNDEAIGRQIIEIIRRLGVHDLLLAMPLASDGENAFCDAEWAAYLAGMTDWAERSRFLV